MTAHHTVTSDTETSRVLPRYLIGFAWASFVSEVLIIVTGGAVRLTGSGLGCPTWPTCTPESLIATPELGIHGAIEFGNRTMTGLVGILAIVVLLLVWGLRRERRDLFGIALTIVLGVAAQALVGGITVLSGLNPLIVGFHYVASVALVCLSAAFLVRAYSGTGQLIVAVPPFFRSLALTAAAALAVTLFVGILTTASGPHSGDPMVERTGFDAELLQHVHAWPSYALGLLTVVLAFIALRRRLHVTGWVLTALLLESAQLVVGLVQSRTGLPELLVGTHMVLAALIAATFTVLLMRLRVPIGIERLERE